jgi:antirestriction protein ArdC
MSSDHLTERERAVLGFEREWWKYAGTKDSAVRTAFDISADDYYRVLNHLLDHPGAHAHDSLLVRRLRRQRSQRQRRRSAARRGSEVG